MRATRWATAVTLGLVAAACGGDDDGADDPAGSSDPGIEVEIDSGSSPIAKVTDVTCGRVDDTQLVAEGVVSSNGDDTHYVSIEVRFFDGDGVRVELATDSVSGLLVGERARWTATTYSDGAEDVRRCEVTATVS